MNKLLCFTAEWCGPCKALKPTLLELEQDRLVYYDIDEYPDKRAAYEVRAVPTLILVSPDGAELDRVMGSQPLSKLQDLLDRV